MDFEADFLLAVGGGSVIDTAKAIAHGTANPETDLWDFWSGKKELKKSLPVGVILTLPAAGSETSDSSVLTNEETGEKAGLPSPFNRPAFAILNPELAFSLSSPQLAAGIVCYGVLAAVFQRDMLRYLRNFVRMRGKQA